MLFVSPSTSMETDTNKKFSKAEWDWRRKSQLEESHVLYRGQKEDLLTSFLCKNLKFFFGLIGPF